MSMAFCGVCLYNGIGSDVKGEEAVSYLKAAATQGQYLGQFGYAVSIFESKDCALERNTLEWDLLKKSAASGCNDAAVILGLQHLANCQNFDDEYFKRALNSKNLCAMYNYGMYLLTCETLTEKTLQEIIRLFHVVITQDGDGSEYDFKRFLAKGIGVDSPDRWRIVLLECRYGLPESQFIYAKYRYSLSNDPQAQKEALEYFIASASRNHDEANFVCGMLLLNEKPLSEVKHYFEAAVRGGILIAQYTYGLLLAKRQDMESRKRAAEVLALGAKEVLLRRQCKNVKICLREKTYPDPEFFYSPIPEELTKRATDAYIWQHLSNNIMKLYRMSWNEILHPRTPTMRPQQSNTGRMDGESSTANEGNNMSESQ